MRRSLAACRCTSWTWPVRRTRAQRRRQARMVQPRMHVPPRRGQDARAGALTGRVHPGPEEKLPPPACDSRTGDSRWARRAGFSCWPPPPPSSSSTRRRPCHAPTSTRSSTRAAPT
ncbi:hypothetical protein GQ55_8G050500 [Panicum hallii var. hallii]|uniref:Uncharacterized protein n=1 Tax=Panicum hallii var. hallii TaxID=1504633 RepID=A0A2T7CKX4_9POAL|nr:hypothetical protein GQ55_8G050500 [Panicum hallii var. hallii]